MTTASTAGGLRKQITAFVSAPAGLDTTFLRELLSANGVIADDPYSIEAGEAFAAALVRRIRAADCVIAVLTEGTWTAYEVGVSDALGKPTLIVSPPEVRLPSQFAAHQHLRSNFSDTGLLRLTVERFFDEVRAGKLRQQPRSGPSKKLISRRHSINRLIKTIRQERPTLPSHSAEALVAQLFQLVSVNAVAKEGRSRDTGADFALWVDELGQTVGNPVVVEVKAGALTAAQLDKAEFQLQRAVLSAGARLGILLYLDRHGRRFEDRQLRSFDILRFDIEDFAALLQARTLAEVIVNRRNQLAHGIG